MILAEVSAQEQGLEINANSFEGAVGFFANQKTSREIGQKQGVPRLEESGKPLGSGDGLDDGQWPVQQKNPLLDHVAQHVIPFAVVGGGDDYDAR